MYLPDVIFSVGIDRALGWTVLHTLWQFTAIAFITGILLLGFRQKSAQFRYLLTNFALLTGLLAAIGTFSWYAASPAPVAPNTPQPIASVAAANQQPAPENLPVLPHTPAVQEEDMYTYFNQHLPLVVVLWCAGIAVFLLRLLGNLLRVYDMRQRMNFSVDPYWTDLLQQLIQKSGFNKGVALLESALVRSPLTIGHFSPVILFPIGVINRLSEQEVEAILAHELAHVLRRDYLLNILQSFVEALFYFHPAVWWLSAQVRNERENACDDRAIALLGNKINYAKALVTIQEMAFYPQTPALAFAGTQKNQLLRRVQRLFSQPKNSFNIMEKWISTALVVCLVAILAFGQQLNLNNSSEQTTNTQNSGLWEASFTADSVHLTLSSRENGHNWMMGDDVAKSSFTNLPASTGAATFYLQRAAGKMTFTGQMDGNSGYGRFQYEPDASYRVNLAQQGISPTDDALMLQCFFADLPLNYVATLRKRGFGPIDANLLTELAVFRMNEKSIQSYQELASSLGQAPPTLPEMMQMKVADLTPEKVTNLAKAGYSNLSMHDLTQLSMHGVDAAFVAAINQAGLGKLSGEELLSAKIHDLDADFVKKAQKAGLGNLDFDQVLSMKIHNLDSMFISQIPTLGFKNITIDEVMALKIHGVDQAFVDQANQMGFGSLGIEEVLSLKIHGIDSDFVRKAQNIGLGKLSLEEVMSLKIHHIDEEYLKKIQGLGLGKLEFDDVMTMKIHRIDENFINDCKKLNLGTLSLDDLMQIRIHDITPQMADTYRNLGFANLTLDDLTAAKIHRITPEFIQDAAKKGYKFPKLSEYTNLRILEEMKRK
jgi:beta-lactamase regulating signal transducer with metallopeptidase domain